MDPSREHEALAWDAVVWVLATAAAIYAPLVLVFGLVETTPVRGAEVVVTLVFGADAVLRWRRAAGGAGAATAREGLWRFVPGFGRVLGVVAAVPLSLLPVPSALILVRLLKLWRVGQFMRAIRARFIQHLGMVRLVFFVYSMGLGSHWIACGWIALGGVGEIASPASRYIAGLYWSVTTLATVGYGDIAPTTDLQRLFAMGVMMVGVGVYGFIIGTVATILASIDPARANYLQRMEQLSAFMAHRDLPRGLQQRLADYYRYVWLQRLDHDESDLLDGLPPSLGTEVAMFLKRDLLEHVPLFRDADEEFIREIALRMRSVVFLPGDWVIRAGEKGREMYFVSRGRLEVLSPDGEQWDVMEKGDFFGELALIHDQPRSASVRALEYCDLYRLDRDLFQRVLQHHPEVADHIRKAAAARRHPTPD